jgi:Phosphotransferase enzyme family
MNFVASQSMPEAEGIRVDSEVATLKFLEKIGTVPAPRVHDFSATYKNPAKTPYILMDKIAGRTLSDALHEGMPGDAIRRTLEGLASFRKSLRQNLFGEVGSLVFGCDLDDDSDEDEDDQWIGKLASQNNHYFVAELINIWAAHLEPYQYQSHSSASALEYYFGQHTLSLASEGMSGGLHEIAEKWLAHHCIASLLPAYVQPSEHIFYLAHTDLNASNIMVNPLDGTATGIIDWEFANTLPPQAVEHYPAFLATGRERFVEAFHDCLADPSSELDEWRSLYAQHFDDAETVSFHSRIDTIIQFEYLLRHINDCPLERISEVVNALKVANALYAPLPKFPWESFVNAENTTNSTNHVAHTISESTGLTTPATDILTPNGNHATSFIPPDSAPVPYVNGTTSSKSVEPTTSISVSDKTSTNLLPVHGESVERSPPPFSDDDELASSHPSPSQKYKVNSKTDNPPSSPLSSVISSAKFSTFSVKEFDEQDSGTRPEVSSLSFTTVQPDVYITAPDLPLSKTAVDVPTHTTSKMVADMTAQTDYSFPPNQGLGGKESTRAHAGGTWLSAVAGGCVRIYGVSKRAVLRKRKGILCHRGTVEREGIEMQGS